MDKVEALKRQRALQVYVNVTDCILNIP